MYLYSHRIHIKLKLSGRATSDISSEGWAPRRWGQGPTHGGIGTVASWEGRSRKLVLLFFNLLRQNCSNWSEHYSQLNVHVFNPGKRWKFIFLQILQRTIMRLGLSFRSFDKDLFSNYQRQIPSRPVLRHSRRRAEKTPAVPGRSPPTSLSIPAEDEWARCQVCENSSERAKQNNTDCHLEGQRWPTEAEWTGKTSEELTSELRCKESLKLAHHQNNRNKITQSVHIPAFLRPDQVSQLGKPPEGGAQAPGGTVLRGFKEWRVTTVPETMSYKKKVGFSSLISFFREMAR